MATPTGNWIFSLKKGATEEQTAAFAAKVDALGKPQGFKTIDYFPGTVLVIADEAFARQIEKQFASELRLVAPEKAYELPDNRPKIRKAPDDVAPRLKIRKPRGPGGPK